MRRNIPIILFGLFGIGSLFALFLNRPIAPVLGFGVGPWTNDISGCCPTCPQLLLTITNTNDSDFSCRLITEFLSKDGWRPSFTQPIINGFKNGFWEPLPNGSPRTFLISPPVESGKWRVKCHLWRVPTKWQRGINGHIDKIHLLRPFAANELLAEPDYMILAPPIEKVMMSNGSLVPIAAPLTDLMLPRQ